MKQAVLISIVWLFCISYCLPMSHAGKLDGVRKATRKSTPAKRDKPSRDDDHDDDEDDHKHRSRRSSPSRRSSHGHSNHGHSGGWLNLVVDTCNDRPVRRHSQCHSPVACTDVIVVEPCPIAVCPLNGPLNTSYAGDDCVELGGINDGGYVEVIAPPQPAPAPLSEQIDGWSHRLTLNGGTDFDSLDQTQFAWLIQPPGGLGLDVSATMFREDEADYHDALWLGDANLVFEPVFGALRARLGFGVNWMKDQQGFESGLNLTAGFDLAIAEMLVVSGEVDRGSLGDADFSQSQITVGLQTGGVQWFTGYRRHDIGGAKLDGMIYGMRLCF